MKRLLVLASILSVCLSIKTGHAQMVMNIVNPNESIKADSIDRVQFIAQYKLSFVTDTSKADDITEETMMLKVGSKSSSFYSYTKFVTDSAFREELKRSGGRVNRNFEKGQNPGRISYQIFKNFPSGKVTLLDKVATSSFRCEEDNETPQWELLPDTMTVLSYPCQKAKAHFKGRDYEAWFTTEIPRSEGPWKLHGLPGLILKAEDTQKHYVFECSGIEQSKSEEALFFEGSDYEPISRKNLNKLYERFVKDPVGYITSTAPNVKIVVKNESGEQIKPKDQPYNPIEREQ